MHIPVEFSSPIRGVVFDIDGVIFDSRAANIGYYNLVRFSVGLGPLTLEEEDFCHMASAQQCFERIIPEHLRYKAAQACRAIPYREHVLPQLTLQNGLVETLSWLKEAGMPLGICTNRFTGVPDLLHHFGLNDFFCVIKSAKNCRPKPDPQGLQEICTLWDLLPQHIAFIGDTKTDELAAENANVTFFAYQNPELNASLHIPDFFYFIEAIRPLVEGR